jgi:hypothetical protein
MNSVPPIAPKKRYQRPSLMVYGSIQTLTSTVSNNSSFTDSGVVGTMTKTH